MSTAAELSPEVAAAGKQAREQLDAHTYDMVQWHFHDSTGCPFWLEYKQQLKFDPLKEIKNYEDLKKFESCKDEWLRGGPVRRWVPTSRCTCSKPAAPPAFPKAASPSTIGGPTTRYSAKRCPTNTFHPVPTG
jgi:hypothetical protein